MTERAGLEHAPWTKGFEVETIEIHLATFSPVNFPCPRSGNALLLGWLGFCMVSGGRDGRRVDRRVERSSRTAESGESERPTYMRLMETRRGPAPKYADYATSERGWTAHAQLNFSRFSGFTYFGPLQITGFD